MKIELGIGTMTQAVEIPDADLLDVLTPNKVEYDQIGRASCRERV